MYSKYVLANWIYVLSHTVKTSWKMANGQLLFQALLYLTVNDLVNFISVMITAQAAFDLSSDMPCVVMYPTCCYVSHVL